MKKKLFSMGALACACVMGASLTCVTLGACSNESKTEGDAVAFVSLDINPSIEITLDKNNKVVSVYGANEDGRVLLYGEEGIVGADIEVAVGKITALAVELGYLDDDNLVVETTVTTSDDEGEEVERKVSANVTLAADRFDLEVVCESEGTYSLVRSIESLKAQYPDLEALQEITLAKAKLVLSAVETGLVTVQEAVEMTTRELIVLVSEAHKAAEEFATEAYQEAVSAAQAAYEEALGAALDGIYLSYYTSKHPATAYYGAIYQAYKSSARTLKAIATSVGYVHNVSKYPLSETQIAAVAAALGLEDASVLEDSDGNVTIKSVEAYADKLFKNSKAAAELGAVRAQLNAALDTVEAELRATAGELAQQYGPQIEAVTGIVRGTAQRFIGLLHNPMLPEEVRALINECSEITEELQALTADGDLTAEEIRTLAAKLDEKAAAVLQAMENDLTEEELAEIAALQQKALDGIAEAKSRYENAVETAREEAKAHIEALKAARKAHWER